MAIPDQISRYYDDGAGPGAVDIAPRSDLSGPLIDAVRGGREYQAFTQIGDMPAYCAYSGGCPVVVPCSRSAEA